MVQCAVQCSVLNTVHCTVYTVQLTLYTVHCTVYSLHSTVYTVQCTAYTLQCTLYTVQLTLYSVHRFPGEGLFPIAGTLTFVLCCCMEVTLVGNAFHCSAISYQLSASVMSMSWSWKSDWTKQKPKNTCAQSFIEDLNTLKPQLRYTLINICKKAKMVLSFMFIFYRGSFAVILEWKEVALLMSSFQRIMESLPSILCNTKI